MLRGDFHLHSEYSHDGTTTIGQMIQAVQRARLDCVALTDHDTIDGALELARHAPFRVIIGEEISSSEGHIIGLFLQEAVPAGLDAPETIARIKDQGGLVVAPHPFARIIRSSLNGAFLRNYELFDAIETANSNNLIRADDRRAALFAGPGGLPAIGGSDAHQPSGIGSNVVEMPDFSNPAEFIDALRGAKIRNRLHSPACFCRSGFRSAAELVQNLGGRMSTASLFRTTPRAAAHPNPHTMDDHTGLLS